MEGPRGATTSHRVARGGLRGRAYFEWNRDRMRYKTFGDRGYFIGSGVVEAACKTLGTQSLKCSGMHWSEKGLSNIRALRTAILSNRNDELWRHFKQFRKAS